MKRGFKAYLIIAIFLSFGVALFVGCGGGSGTGPATDQASGGGSSSDSTARVAIEVEWPPEVNETRLIPVAAKSLSVEVKKGAVSLTRKSINRGTNRIVIDGLPVGDLTFIATAHPQADGVGNAQGRAEIIRTTKSGTQITVDLTLRSTITKLVVTPNPITLVPGGSPQTITLTAYDARGVAVVIDPARQIAQKAGEGGDGISIQLLSNGTRTIRAFSDVSAENTYTRTFIETESAANPPVQVVLTIKISCPVNLRRADGSCAEPTPVPTPTTRPTATPRPTPTSTPRPTPTPGSCANPNPQLMNGPGCNGCSSYGDRCNLDQGFWRYDCETGECINLNPR